MTAPTMTRAQVEAIAQIPRTCTCGWNWTGGQAHRDGRPAAWVRVKAEDSCPWHTGRTQ